MGSTCVEIAGSGAEQDTLFAVTSVSSSWIRCSKGACLLCICWSSAVVSSNRASKASERAYTSEYCERSVWCTSKLALIVIVPFGDPETAFAQVCF